MPAKRYLRPDTGEIVEVLPGLRDNWIAGTRKPNGSIKRLKSKSLPACGEKGLCQNNLDLYVTWVKGNAWPVVEETASTLCCSEQDQIVKEETTTLTVRESDMGAVALNRKQRLRTLENHIRKCAEDIQKSGLEIGRDLCEIRDDELWVDEYGSWNQYLKERAGELVGKSFANCKLLIQSAEIGKRLPSGNTCDLKYRHLTELNRLVPDKQKDDGPGREKDYSRLRKQDVARVLKTATELAGGESPSVRDVRKAVDAELGIDRTSKAAETKERSEAGIDLEEYLRQCEGRILGITKNLAKVPGESWKLLEESDPGLATRVAEACDELAELLRS